VEISADEWVGAREAVNELGPFSVVTGDNPFSVPLDDEANRLRRDELRGILQHHGVRVLPSIARDPSGEWPDEQGFALLGQSDEFVRALARAFEQFAYYDVLEDAVLVRGCADGEALV
jgi:hypothetical protein